MRRGASARRGYAHDARMSFRSRLTLFFVAIVIVPMVAMAVVLFRLLSDNESGKADARLAANQAAAIGLAQAATESAKTPSGHDRVDRRRPRDRDPPSGLRRDPGAPGAAPSPRPPRPDRRLLAHRLDRSPTAAARCRSSPPSVPLQDAEGKPFGSLQVSTQTAGHYVSLVRTTTGLNAVVYAGDGVIASALPGVQTRRAPRPARRTSCSTASATASTTFPAPGSARAASASRCWTRPSARRLRSATAASSSRAS